MTTCLKCGAENPATNKYCLRCEMPLPNSGVGGTLTGGETPAVAGSPEAEDPKPAEMPPRAGMPKGRAALQQTLLGMAPGLMSGGPAHAPPVAPPTPPVPPAAPTSGAKASASEQQPASALRPADLANRTLIGIPPGAVPPLEPKRAPLGGTVPQGVPVVARQPALATPTEDARSRPAGFEPVRAAATILGSTSPLDAPARSPAVPAGEATHAEIAPPVRPEPAAPGLERTALAAPEATIALPNEAPVPPGGQIKTHLGVAIPGIAPLRPGVSAPPAAPAAPPRAPIEATQLQPQASTMTIMGRPQMPRSALVLLISGLVLLLSAGAFALFWKGASPLSAVVSADPSGKDRIDIVCETCPDGTRLSLGPAATEVRERKAYLVVAEPLPLGENTLAFGLQLPGEETETVEVTLPPLEYRIKADTSTLVGDQPRVTLDIRALPGSSVNIGGNAVSLDAAGRGQIAIDIAERLTGPANEVVSFEQGIAYAIQPPSGKNYSGELQVKIGVTPLILEAPGTDTVTDLERFMLAGRTMIAAEVWVAGASISVDSSGRFAQLMSIDSVGETKVTVRASAPGLAPRFAAFRLRRVKDLRAELDTLSRSALPLSRAATNPDAKLDSPILVRGKVEEVRVDGQRTFIIVASDEQCDGRFCLARLVYGGLRKLERGMTVTAVGRLLGSVGAAGADRVPEIEVSLLR